MNRIDQVFQQLRSQGRKAFMPFITAGDPDLATTMPLIQELSRRGASLIELGIPYSDPIADGPVIQASYTRAIQKQLKLDAILNAVQERTHSSAQPNALVPLVAMVSYAIVFRHGLERFVVDAKRAGFEGAIVPDLPVEEAAELAGIAARHDFKLILLVTPTTPRERAAEIARVSTGFIYFVSVTGITGERTTIPDSVLEQVAWLKTQTPLPICIGFGISQPEHVRMLRPVADGVIVGSAIVRRIADRSGKPVEQIVQDVGEFAASLIETLND
jgi:tryptophan synthase alpha chain